jgi:membrane fusion protein, epimerase transport system
MKLRPRPAPPSEIVRPSDSARGATKAGWIIIALFFGVFGGWAVFAPLNAAVVGDAVIKVEGNRKSIQHLNGGTVSEILVREGDRVEAGDAVLRLDDTVVRADVDLLTQQLLTLLATEARMRAEFERGDSIEFPSELINAENQSVALAAMTNQRAEFDSRRRALTGKEEMLRQRVVQYEERITGLRAKTASLSVQRDSVASEHETLAALLEQGLTTRTRVLELERRQSALAAEISTAEADIAALGSAIIEAGQEIEQFGRDQNAELSAELRDIRSKLLDLEPRLRAARLALDAAEVRSPYSGKVVDLAVFSVGAVIGRGERLMDIVPEDSSLVVEARIRVEDIADIAPGMGAEVHFTSYKQRITPLIRGTVVEISADRLTDERTQIPYYVAQVDVDQTELAASPEIELYPGMPAVVMITTEERSALDYVIGPLFASFDRSFRER